jgi:hypothetical protein
VAFFSRTRGASFGNVPLAMSRVVLASAVLGVSLLLFSGCKEDTDQSPAPTGAALSVGALKCKSGIDRALRASTITDANSIYYTECSALFSQPACRDAWVAAAKLPPAEQIPKIADACRKAYCPSLSALSFEACRDDFKATPASLTKMWPTLSDAILTREVGTAAPDVSSAMLTLYVHLKQLEAAEAPAAPASSGSEGAPGSTAASAAPSASAPPAPSGAAAGAKAAAKAKSKAH